MVNTRATPRSESAMDTAVRLAAQISLLDQTQQSRLADIAMGMMLQKQHSEAASDKSDEKTDDPSA